MDEEKRLITYFSQSELHTIGTTVLIENIYVSPKAKDWFRDLVEETAKRYNVEVNVLKSKLNEAPAYLK